MSELEKIIHEAARRAGEIISSNLGKLPVIQKDSTWNFVTEADQRSEECIVNFLNAEVPGSTFLGEEGHCNGTLADKKLWVIDPLDGTTNFAHGAPHFGVSIALAEQGRIIAGGVLDPMRQEFFFAEAGKGATLNSEPIRVSKAATLSQSLIATGFYYDRGETMEKTLQALYRLFKKKIHCMRRMGAASLDITWLACGRHDGYFEYTLSPWDFAAGLLILAEAGGLANDSVSGAPADLTSKGLVCSNGRIHAELLECVFDDKDKLRLND
jgi:myo-inositol-1(or 4)-monophosphatase